MKKKKKKKGGGGGVGGGGGGGGGGGIRVLKLKFFNHAAELYETRNVRHALRSVMQRGRWANV